MKKIIKIILLLAFLSFFIYYGIIRRGFIYFTGIGTDYSYFAAQKAKKDSILVFYERALYHPMISFNPDSLRRKYGFEETHGGQEVSYWVVKQYNSIIQKELLRRLGKARWEEYNFKLDSLVKESEKKSPFNFVPEKAGVSAKHE